MKLQSAFLICVAAIIALGVAAAIVFMPQGESAPAFDPSAPLPVRIEQVASTRMAELGRVPGLVIGVQIGDTEPVTLALGVADEESGDPMTVDHVFRVASATKPMLGVVALRLAEEGVIDLDATIDKHLPDVPGGDRVTVRMLGNNSAGYFDAIASEAFRAAINTEPDRLWTAQEILGFALAEPLTLEAPGEGWSYSNTNSVVLGEVIRAATGEHWLASLRRLVMEPLALDSVGVEEGGLGVDGVAPAGLPSGYRHARRDSGIQYGDVFIDATAYSPSWAGASGSMYADVHDLLKSAEAVLGGTMLSPELQGLQREWIDTGYSSSAGLFSTPQTIYYGFQIGKRTIQGRDWLGHPGDVPGFSCFYGYQPETRTSLVVLCNLSNTPQKLNPAEEVAEAVMSALP